MKLVATLNKFDIMFPGLDAEQAKQMAMDVETSNIGVFPLSKVAAVFLASLLLFALRTPLRPSDV